MSGLQKSLLTFITFTLFSTPLLASNEVNLYSARKEALIKPLLDKFTGQTGIKVNLVTGKAKALLKRLQSEGRNTPADILLTVDAGNLHAAKLAGLLQPLDNTILKDAMPENLRDPEGYWYALSARSRVIVYSKERVTASELSSYEDLVNPKWQGRICIRSSGNIYNQSLLSSLIAHHGIAKAEAWAKAIVANMAQSPKGNDRAQVKAVAVGVCDIAVVNTYYMGVMLQKDASQQKAASKVAVFFPNQSNRGAHINISGAGLIKGAKHKANAIKLLEFLVSDEAQEWYAQANHEYPVKPGIPVSPIVKAWGYPFKQDGLHVGELGKHNAEAVRVFDRAGWK
ncbi:Ferric iron ABC transporter, iron-binding protein [hydrothermal vent metagenome]|uniref:Ferric iron ABC transporter, iron-binding protein n=1 Tax=hydrothermal vent metagenome TaxID=652676 RepID=A0A3B1BHJ2_9ZZZZ